MLQSLKMCPPFLNRTRKKSSDASIDEKALTRLNVCLQWMYMYIEALTSLAIFIVQQQ